MWRTWGKDRRGERKGDGRMRRERDERGKKIAVRFPDTLPFVPQPAERLSVTVPCDGTGHLWWTARCSSKDIQYHRMAP